MTGNVHAPARVPSGPARDRRPGLGVPLLIFVATGLLYLPHAGIPYFGDDYFFLLQNPRADVFKYFVPYGHMGGEFRPFQMAWCGLNQWLFGESTFVLQAGQIVLHAVMACLGLAFLRRTGFSGQGSGWAAILLVTNPVSVSVVLGNDTMSQVGSTLCGFLSFAMTWRYGHRLAAASPGPQTGRRIGAFSPILCVVALALSLLFKETGLSFSGLLVLMLMYFLWTCGAADRRLARRKLALLLLAFCATTGLYLAYRNVIAPVKLAFGGAGDYDFRLGSNIVINQAFLYVAALLPYSTADLFIAYSHRWAAVLAGIAALAGVWAVIVGWGLVRARAWGTTLGLLVAASCATVPMTLMNHVSELYAYNMIPFLSPLLALALGALLKQHHRRGTRVVVTVVLAAVLVSNVVAVTRKAMQMQANGQAAARLSSQVVDYAKGLPPQGRILLLNQHPERVCYSVFLTSDFHGLLVAEDRIRQLAGRPDVSIKVVDEETGKPADLILIRDNSTGQANVRVLPASGDKSRAAK